MLFLNRWSWPWAGGEHFNRDLSDREGAGYTNTWREEHSGRGNRKLKGFWMEIYLSCKGNKEVSRAGTEKARGGCQEMRWEL